MHLRQRARGASRPRHNLFHFSQGLARVHGGAFRDVDLFHHSAFGAFSSFCIFMASITSTL